MLISLQTLDKSLVPHPTNVDEPSHSGEVGSVAHNWEILKTSAATDQTIQDHPELCSVPNVGALAVKFTWHNFFGIKF